MNKSKKYILTNRRTLDNVLVYSESFFVYNAYNH